MRASGLVAETSEDFHNFSKLFGQVFKIDIKCWTEMEYTKEWFEIQTQILGWHNKQAAIRLAQVGA
jgi:hypothetical protein